MNSFEKNEVDSNQKWFNRSLFKLGTLTAVAFGVYKIKGPTGILVSKYLDAYKTKIINRERIKQFDSQEFQLGPNANVRQPYFGIQYNDPIFNKEYQKEIENIKIQQNYVTINYIENTENTLIKKIESDVGFAHGGRRATIGENSSHLYPIKDISFDSDEILYKVREDALYEYLSIKAGLRDSDRSTLESFKGTSSDKDKLKEIHKYYLYNDPEYSDLYEKRLRKIKKSYVASSNSFIANQSNEMYSLEIKKRLYGGEVFDDSIESAVTQRALSGKAGQGYRIHDFDSNINVFDLIKSEGRITSGSLNKIKPTIKDAKFSLLSQFDYTPMLQEIGNKIEELKTDRAAESMVKNINYEIISRGGSSKPSYYLKLSFQHIKFAGIKTLEIPLSQHGLLPGAAPGLTDSLDGFYLIHDQFKQVNKDLKVNIDVQNKTQQMLRNLIDILDSNMMENEFSINPDKFIRRATDKLNILISDAPRAEGTVRDSIRALRLVTNPNIKSKYALRRLKDSLESSRNIRNIAEAVSKGKDILNITLDFETVSRDLPGPEHIVRDAFTQITKFGFAESSYRNGKLVISSADEIISDHGYYRMKDYGWTQDTADWLRKELGPKSNSLQTPNEVGEAWGKQIREQAAIYQKNGGKKFSNNEEMIEHVTDKLINKIETAISEGKEIFITSKNGTFFDLELIRSKAPLKYDKLKKYAQFIDLQSVAYYQKVGFGGHQSLALNKMIMKQMGRYGAKGDDLINIDRPGNVQKALDFFRRKGSILVGEDSYQNWIGRNFLSRAHSSPAADTIMTSILLSEELNKFTSGDRSYKNLGDLEKFLSDSERILGIDESMEEYRLNEKNYTINGMVVSASAMSHGQIHKHYTSLLSMNHLIPFSDNTLSKQHDQFFMGVALRPSDVFKKNLANRTDLEKRQLQRKYFTPSFISEGEISATSWKLNADAMTNEFSHHLISDTVYVFNSWRGQEGYNAFSQKVFDRVQTQIKKYIDLSDVSSKADDVQLSHKARQLIESIHKKAKSLAKTSTGEHVTKSMYDVAVRQVIAEQGSKGLGIHIPKGSEFFLSKGDKGIETVKAELDGYITNILVNTDAGGAIRMQAEVLYTATGNDFTGTTFNYRSLGTKSSAVIDRWLSEGLAMGGAEHVAVADFIEKGYIGAQKQLITEKIIDKLMDQKLNGTAKEQEKADRQLKKLSLELNSRVDANKGMLIHDPDVAHEMHFKNITNPEDLIVAKKVFGNIDMNLEKLSQHLIDAEIVWKKEKMMTWYKMWAGPDSKDIYKTGRARASEWIEQALKNATEEIDKNRSNKNHVLNSFSDKHIDNIKRDMSVHLKEFFLPTIEKVNAGKAPMYFEPIAKFVNKDGSPQDDTPFVPGFRVRERGAIYNIMKGRAPKSTDLKLRGGLLQLIDTPFSHVSKTTLDHLKRNKRYNNEARFEDAIKTLARFKDALISKAMQTENLTLAEINQLLNRKGSMDIEKLKRWNLSDADKIKVKNQLTDLILEESKNLEDFEKSINSIIADLETNRLADAFEKNNNFVSASAIDSWAQIAKKKGVFAYSANSALGGVFSFDIRKHLVDLGYADKDLSKHENSLINMFRELAQTPDSLVDTIDVTTGTVTLKKIIMHADTSPQNIANVLNPGGKSTAFGYYSGPTKQTYNVLEGIKHWEDAISQKKNKETIASAESYLKKQYLNYMINGFLLDSSSVYARATELSPRGIQAPIRGAAQIIEYATDIIKRGGWKSIDATIGTQKLAEYDNILNNIVKTNVSDIFMTKGIAQKFEISKGVTIENHLKTIFGSDKASKVADIMSGKEYLYGYMTRHPNMQAGYNAILDTRMHIIPNEVGEWLGMNSNEIQVHAQYTKLVGADFDGDIGYFVMKPLKDVKSLMSYSKEHSESLAKTLDSIVKGGHTLRQAIKEKQLIDIDINKGGMLVGSFNETGDFITKHLSANDPEITSIMTKTFKAYADNFKTTQMNSAGYVTAQYARSELDRIAQVGVSKLNIGLFTNIAYSRTRQLMQVGLIGKNSVAAKALIGNLNEGDAGIAQMFISLGKHPENIQRLAQASKAFITPLTNDEQAHKALLETMQDFYKDDTLKASSHYNTWMESMKLHATAIPKNSTLRLTHKALENIDYMREGTNVSDLILSLVDSDMIKEYYPQNIPRKSIMAELGDNLTKKFKFDFSTMGTIKKTGKFAAIGAAAYIASNFFRPNQLSNSLNPLDAFTDLGVDVNGNHNAISSSLELDRSVPLDMVNASFTKQAFIKLNTPNIGSEKAARSQIIDKLLEKSYKSTSSILGKWSMSPNVSYQNYTTYIPGVGSNQLNKRY